MAEPVLSAESRLSRLLERLLSAAEAALAGGDVDSARATAEEVLAVDPDNQRATTILSRVQARQLAPSGERALMTLLFADLVGSTMLSEQVEPERLRDLFSFYRDAARDAVGRYGGSLVQFSGDGILAGFGYPDPHEDDARRAVLAGLDLVVAMHDARSELERRLGLTADIRVGIHTGQVVITDLRDANVAEKDSIVGVTPNLASRVQGVAEPGMVVISDVTRQLVDVDFYLHSLGEQALKGISRAVEVFAVDRPRYAAARFEAERYHRAGLVGREAPYTELISAWDAVRESRTPAGGSTLLVVGEAGIGKSRLVVELIDRVETTGGRVVGVGCLPYYANVSLWPIARMLERVVDVHGDDPLSALESHLGSLGLDRARAMPFLGPLIGISDQAAYPAPELDPAAFLAETINVVIEWLSALAAQVPLLLAVEDLHWADPSTLNLLGRLAARGGSPPADGSPNPRILTVTTSRETTSVPWADGVRLIELGRLDVDAAAQLVANLVPGGDVSSVHGDSIVEQAEGVPLFIEELTRSRLDTKGTEPVPLRVQELFTWRFKAPGVDLRVVQVAATVGPVFHAPVVAGVLEDEDRVRAQLRTLVEQGIIEPGDPAADTYRFRHALMRDAAYETQVLDARKQTHAKVAEVLSARGAEPALVAAHLDLAGEAAQAVGLYLVAVQSEQGRGAHQEAGELATRAIELAATLPESHDRDLGELTARMLRAFSVSSMKGYAAPEVQDDHRSAEVLATKLGKVPQVVPSLIASWGFWFSSGSLETSRRILDRLTELVGDPAFASFVPEVEVVTGYQDWYEGHLDLAEAHVHRAVVAYDARSSETLVSPFWILPNDPVAVALIALACIKTLRGEPGAQEWEDKAIRRAEEIGFPRGPFSRAFVKLYTAWNRRFLGDSEGAWKLGSEIVAIGQEHGYAFWIAMGAGYLATDQAPSAAEHRAFLRQAIATLDLMGQEAFKAFNLSYLAGLHAAAGELERALELVGEGIQVVHTSGELLHLPELLRQRAVYSLGAGGDPDEAVAGLEEAVRVATEQGSRITQLRAALDLARLPVELRPADWRRVLAEARNGLAPGVAREETTAADALLDTVPLAD